MGLRPGGGGAGAGLRPGGAGGGLRPGASLGGGAGAGGGGGGVGGGASGGSALGSSSGGVNMQRVNPVRRSAPPVPDEFVPMGKKDETGRMTYSKDDLLKYSGLTERWDGSF